MSKIFSRYEHYKTPFGEMIFDRQTHSLLNKETHEVNSNEIKTSPNDVLFAIFPNQILSHIHLPSWLITVSIISSFILFIVLAFLLKLSFQLPKVQASQKFPPLQHLKKYYLKLVAGQMIYKHLLFELPA